MTSTALEPYIDNGAVAIFDGASADEILAVAADVATKFGDVVKKQRMFKRIGENDHIQIEAWQTIGALTGVVAPDGEVEQIPWPHIAPLPDEPPQPGREPRNRDSDEWRVWKRADRVRSAWEIHEDMLRAQSMGKAYGFICRFRATKNGRPVGWGENSVDRNESNFVNKDDHELRAMSETRAQSRALGAPLKFVVKLAGYETTPAEDLDGELEAANARIAVLEKELAAAVAKAGAGGEVSKYGALANDEQEQTSANLVHAIAAAAPVAVEGEQFILAMGQHFDGVPLSCFTMLKGLQRLIAAAHAAAEAGSAAPENAPPDPAASAYHNIPDDVVYPPGHYQGD